MLKYNNSHIFTGYLKQLLSSFALPSCKVYSHEFANYLKTHGTEDPRVLGSTVSNNTDHLVPAINYLKNDTFYQYFAKNEADLYSGAASWQRCKTAAYYSPEKAIQGITRSLYSPSNLYDNTTHEYLGDYLRFIRDYYDIDLMSLYNCFTDKICNNIDVEFAISSKTSQKATFDAYDSKYRIYMLPVKLFSSYTIAIDSNQGIEVFCGFYRSGLDVSRKGDRLATKTYQKFNKTLFGQPILYNKLSVENWPAANDFTTSNGNKTIRTDSFTRWDLTAREKDLRLFIKVPSSCTSTITVLEGDFRSFNDIKYAPVGNKLIYQNNHNILNFNTNKHGDNIDLNNYTFKPISKLQLLAINTGESYPFADRLIEYLTGSAITSMDEIADNIKRAQKVMQDNKYYFEIDGIWENKMQNIVYDYMMNSGEICVQNNKLVDKHMGYHRRQGHNTKSTTYDILGYLDKDAEKLYASWKNDNGTAKIKTSMQSVDIYDGLYDI